MRPSDEKVGGQQYEFAVPHFFEKMANDELVFADIELAVALTVESGDASRATRVVLVMKW